MARPEISRKLLGRRQTRSGSAAKSEPDGGALGCALAGDCEAWPQAPTASNVAINTRLIVVFIVVAVFLAVIAFL
jgi:hypothetical protein